MNTREMQKMEEFAGTHWWFVSRRRLAIGLLKKYADLSKKLTILDLGCGTGDLLQELGGFAAIAAKGLDISPEMAEICRGKGLSGIYLGDACKMGFEDESFDAVTALDMFEHIDDDCRALGETYRVLKKGGILILSVPALKLLWSGHDEALSHKRRYLRKLLIQRLADSKFKILRITYCLSFLFLPIFAVRAAKKILLFRKDKCYTDLAKMPGFLNQALIDLQAVENILITSGFNFPLGVSLAAVCRKE